MFDPKRIAKLGCRLFVSASVNKLATNVLADHTNFDPESITSRVVTGMAGEVAAQKAEPHTDALVENVAARWAAYKDNKKNNTETK